MLSKVTLQDVLGAFSFFFLDNCWEVEKGNDCSNSAAQNIKQEIRRETKRGALRKRGRTAQRTMDPWGEKGLFLQSFKQPFLASRGSVNMQLSSIRVSSSSLVYVHLFPSLFIQHAANAHTLVGPGLILVTHVNSH